MEVLLPNQKARVCELREMLELGVEATVFGLEIQDHKLESHYQQLDLTGGRSPEVTSPCTGSAGIP